MTRNSFITFLKITIPSLIATALIVVTITFLNTNSERSQAENQLNGRFQYLFHSRIEYQENGDVDLEKVLGSAGFTVSCYRPRFPDDCNISLPSYDGYNSISLEYGVHSLSVWDNQGNLIQVFPEDKRDELLESQKDFKRIAQGFQFEQYSDTSEFKKYFHYKLLPSALSYTNSEREPVVHSSLIRNAGKTKVLGATFLIMDYQTQDDRANSRFYFIFLYALSLPWVLVVCGAFSAFYARKDADD